MRCDDDYTELIGDIRRPPLITVGGLMNKRVTIIMAVVRHHYQCRVSLMRRRSIVVAERNGNGTVSLHQYDRSRTTKFSLRQYVIYHYFSSQMTRLHQVKMRICGEITF